MVIPVCFKCQNPIKIISDPQEGAEVISYHCVECNHSTASFLLGYVEPTNEQLENTPQAGEETIERSQFFGKTDKRYKLRAKMQPLLDMRASGDGPLRPKTSKSSPDTD